MLLGAGVLVAVGVAVTFVQVKPVLVTCGIRSSHRCMASESGIQREVLAKKKYCMFARLVSPNGSGPDSVVFDTSSLVKPVILPISAGKAPVNKALFDTMNSCNWGKRLRVLGRLPLSPCWVKSITLTR